MRINDSLDDDAEEKRIVSWDSIVLGMAGWKNWFIDSLRRIDTCPTRVIARSFDSRWKKRIGRAFIGNRFSRSTTIPADRFILLFSRIDFTNRIEYDRTGKPAMLDGISVSIDPEDRSETNVLLVDGPPGSSRTFERASNSLIDSHARCLFGIPAARACRGCTFDSTNSFTDFLDSASKMTTVVVDISTGSDVSRSRGQTDDSPNPLEMSIGRKWATIEPWRRMIDRTAAPIDPPGRRPSRTITTYVVGDRGERDRPLFLSARPRRRWPRVLDGAPGSVVGRWRTMHDRWPI